MKSNFDAYKWQKRQLKLNSRFYRDFDETDPKKVCAIFDPLLSETNNIMMFNNKKYEFLCYSGTGGIYYIIFKDENGEEVSFTTKASYKALQQTIQHFKSKL